jgi:hypothetical protein
VPALVRRLITIHRQRIADRLQRDDAVYKGSRWGLDILARRTSGRNLEGA